MAEALREISHEDARRMVQNGAQLIDVRTEHEWDAGRIVGAVHVPLAELSERVLEIERHRPVVVYCRTGIRSRMAGQALAAAGYDTSNLSEGIVGWAGAGLPIDPDGGYVAESGEAAARLEARRRDASG